MPSMQRKWKVRKAKALITFYTSRAFSDKKELIEKYTKKVQCDNFFILFNLRLEVNSSTELKSAGFMKCFSNFNNFKWNEYSFLIEPKKNSMVVHICYVFL